MHQQTLPPPLTDADIVGMLRAEVLSGRPLIALDGAGASGRCLLYSAIRETAFVKGRLPDVAVVDFAPGEAFSRVGPHAHRLDAARAGRFRPLLLGKRRANGSLSHANDRQGTFDTRPTNPFPLFRADDVLRRNLLAVFRGTTWLDGGSWLIDTVQDGARKTKAPPPLVFATNVDLALAARVLKWEHAKGRSDGKVQGHLSVMGAPEAMRRALAEAPEADAWESVRSSKTGLPAIVGDGVLHVLSDGGRTVASCTLATGRGPITLIIDVSPEGWCHLGGIERRHGEACVPPAELAADVWRAGIEGLALRHPQRCIMHPGHPSDLHDRTWGDRPEVDALLAFANARHDPALQAACLLAPEPGKVFARIAGATREGAWRRQFVLSFPGLANLVLDPGMAAVIDKGGETLPAVARMLDVPVPVARRLVGRRPMPLVGNAPYMPDAYAHTGRVLSLIGHDGLPRDEAGWADMLACLKRGLKVLTWSDAHEGPALAHVVRLLVGIPGPWDKRKRTLEEAALGEADMIGAADMIASYQILLNALDRHIPADVSDHVGLALMARHGNLPALIRASRRWHEDPILARSDGRVPRDASWPVPFGHFDLGDGWSATCLASSAELVAEGCLGPDPDGIDGLDHCVSTYAATCMGGHSLIVSIRHERDGIVRRRGTAELVADPREASAPWAFGDRTFRRRQYQALRNATPDQPAKAALNRLMVALKEERVPLDLDALLPRRTSLQRVSIAFARERLDLWRPYLPRSLAAMDAEAQVREARDVLRILGPGNPRRPPRFPE